MKKRTKLRHRVFFALARPIGRLIARKYRFKASAHPMERGKNYLILSNHQTFWDPVFLSVVLRRPIYFVATDTLYSEKWYLRLLFFCFGPIKKRKGIADVGCIRAMAEIAKEGGTLALFPEGNRQWNDSMFPIDRSIVKLVRFLKLPVIFFNFRGGYGVQPRWGKALRKGKYTGEVKEVLSWERIVGMSDETLYEKIVSSVKVIDSKSGERYISEERAEYLERELFVCPKCLSAGSLHSCGSEIRCAHCGLTVRYGEDLRLSSSDPSFPFDKLVDWYRFQQRYVCDFDIGGADVLCSDDGVTLYDKTERKQIVLASGRLVLRRDELSVGDKKIPTAHILAGSAVGGNKLSFDAGERSYLLVGQKRFNVIKYLLFFNRVCELIQKKGGDNYYGLSIDPDCL